MRMILLLSALLLVSCSQDVPIKKIDRKALLIERTPEGFDILSPDKEILLEFTRGNTDSSSLETLKYIYEVAQEQSAGDDEKIKLKERPNENVILSLR